MYKKDKISHFLFPLQIYQSRVTHIWCDENPISEGISYVLFSYLSNTTYDLSIFWKLVNLSAAGIFICLVVACERLSGKLSNFD